MKLKSLYDVLIEEYDNEQSALEELYEYLRDRFPFLPAVKEDYTCNAILNALHDGAEMKTIDEIVLYANDWVALDDNDELDADWINNISKYFND